jgi:hypothetical protein
MFLLLFFLLSSALMPLVLFIGLAKELGLKYYPDTNLFHQVAPGTESLRPLGVMKVSFDHLEF